MAQEMLWFSVFCVALFVVVIGAIVIYYACKQQLQEELDKRHKQRRVQPIDLPTPIATVEITIDVPE